MTVNYPLAIGITLFWCAWWIALRNPVMDSLSKVYNNAVKENRVRVVRIMDSCSTFMLVVLVLATIYTLGCAVHYAYHTPQVALSHGVGSVLIAVLLGYEVFFKRSLNSWIEGKQLTALADGDLDTLTEMSAMEKRVGGLCFLLYAWLAACVIYGFITL